VHNVYDGCTNSTNRAKNIVLWNMSKKQTAKERRELEAAAEAVAAEQRRQGKGKGKVKNQPAQVPARVLVQGPKSQKPSVISKPKDAIGSKKTYGTPYNAVNSQLNKFTPSSCQAALLSWSHTVANPRTPTPHPVPVSASTGASAAEARMYQLPQKGTAVANAAGYVFIGINADGWPAATIQEANSQAVIPARIGQYLTFDTTGVSTPVHYTAEDWTGGSVAGTPSQYPSMTDKVMESLGGGGQAGLHGVPMPEQFVKGLTNDTRYTLVSCELRCRPQGKVLDEEGELCAFNFRTTPVRQKIPGAQPSSYAPGLTYEQMLSVPEQYLSRERVTGKNWPPNKWLTVVPVPNTTACFGQWFPVESPDDDPAGLARPRVAGRTADPAPLADLNPNSHVGLPLAFICGKGLEPGTPIEWEATFNYAVYGIDDYQITNISRDETAVGLETLTNTVDNGLRMTLAPSYSTDKGRGSVSGAGVAGAVKAEQAAGRMPAGSGSDTVKSIVSGVQGASEIFEGVTGTSIGEAVMEGLGMLAAFL